MKIKKGDNVILLAGKNRGKTGKVVRAIPRNETVIVEGVNTVKRRQRPRREGQKGQVVEVAMPVHVSNVAILDPKTNKRSRIGFSTNKKGEKVRIAKKSGAEV